VSSVREEPENGADLLHMQSDIAAEMQDVLCKFNSNEMLAMAN
jgi:hypothetical protein